MSFDDPILNERLKKARRKFKPTKKIKGAEFCSQLRKGKRVVALTPFHRNYKMCWKFKRDFKHKDSGFKLRELCRLSLIKIDDNTQTYEKRRSNKHRATKPCWVCTSWASCQHHIIQLKNGGYDNGINRIPICVDCHEVIHPHMRHQVEEKLNELDLEYQEIVSLNYT